MHFTRLRRIVVIVALVGTSLPAAGAVGAASDDADTVLEWNLNASNAIVGVARQPPQSAILSFAMVQGAVYDAVNAIDGGHQPYLGAPRARRSDSKDAAVAAAAFRVLIALFPTQEPTLRPLYDASLAQVPNGRPKTRGIAVGEAAARAMLEARANDGRGVPTSVPIGSDPGEWRPTPPALLLDPTAWVANVRPFLIKSTSQFRSSGPRALTSAAYARDYNEVKAVGAIDSATRTADQTDAAIFWQDNGAALWNRIFRTLVDSEGLDAGEAARLLAMTNMAGADGGIACWNDKYYFNFWRPITAIQEADDDGNRRTEADPDWMPLFATPPFPDHPSGHSCVSGSIVNTLQDYFGTDRIGFSAFSNNSMTTRSFDRLSDAIEEIIDARVWAGIHFRTADVQGAAIGNKVANWLDRHYFQPVD